MFCKFCEFCKISKTTFFTEHLWEHVSVLKALANLGGVFKTLQDLKKELFAKTVNDFQSLTIFGKNSNLDV